DVRRARTTGAQDSRARRRGRLQSRRPRGSIGAREPPEIERPRYFSHPQLHGRCPPRAGTRGRHGDPDDQARVRVTSALLLTTAIEAVVRAGDLQLARFGRDIQIGKKGAIDLVTEVDIAVERMFRELIAGRFPDHQILAEEMGGSVVAPAGPCWVFDPIDGTTNYAHGLPIFCASVALEIGGRAEVAAVYDP